ALRQVGEAVNVLEIGIGLGLAPAITKFANSLTLWLEHGGSKQVIAFFVSLADFAQHAVDVFQHQVIPVFQAINTGWNAIPPELRDFNINGVLAEQTFTRLFGFVPGV